MAPPVHGVTVMNELIFNSNKINDGIEKDLVQITYSRRIGEVGKFSFMKLRILIDLIFKIISKILVFKPTHVYFTIVPAGRSYRKDLLFVTIFKLFGIKQIFHLHGLGIEDASNSRISRKIYEWVFKNNIIIHLSEKLAKNELNKLKFKNTRLYIANNGIEIFGPHPVMKKNEDELTILFLSNLSPTKGLFVLLDAYLLLKPYPGKKLKLLLVGEIPSESLGLKIKEYKERSENEIKVMGGKFNSEKTSILAGSDIFVHPTLNDAFPLVILEAMQAQLPIISTFQGAIPEMIIDNESGILVKENDPDELAKKMQFLIDNENFRNFLGGNAKKRFFQNYTLEIFENKMAEIFIAV